MYLIHLRLFVSIPPYRDQNITKEVKVYMQLQRPNDGAVSEPREFYYRPDPYSACRKRARLNNSGRLLLTNFTLSCYAILKDQVPQIIRDHFTSVPKTQAIPGSKYFLKINFCNNLSFIFSI